MLEVDIFSLAKHVLPSNCFGQGAHRELYLNCLTRNFHQKAFRDKLNEEAVLART